MHHDIDTNPGGQAGPCQRRQPRNRRPSRSTIDPMGLPPVRSSANRATTLAKSGQRRPKTRPLPYAQELAPVEHAPLPVNRCVKCVVLQHIQSLLPIRTSWVRVINDFVVLLSGVASQSIYAVLNPSAPLAISTFSVPLVRRAAGASTRLPVRCCRCAVRA